jgi:hypothetical protein
VLQEAPVQVLVEDVHVIDLGMGAIVDDSVYDNQYSDDEELD